MKNKGLIIFVSIAILAILAVLTMGNLGMLSVVGVGSTLDYQTEWRLNDPDTGVGRTEAFLKLPDLTNEFSFSVDYSGDIESVRDHGTCNVDVDYEIYNFQTKSWFKFHDKSWSLKEYDIRASELRFDGDNLYQYGKPELIESIKTRDSSSSANRRYNYYWSCYDGMTVQQLLDSIVSARETDSRYTFKCLYGGNYISEHDIDDDYWSSNDIVFFQKLFTYGNSVINENNTVRFRITVNKKSYCQSLDENDFKIELFDVKTELVRFNRFANNDCSEVEVFTYQKIANDYEKLYDCQDNIIVQKWISTDKICSLQSIRYTEISSKTYDTEQECLDAQSIFRNPIFLIFGGIIIIAAIGFVIFFIRRRR